MTVNEIEKINQETIKKRLKEEGIDFTTISNYYGDAMYVFEIVDGLKAFIGIYPNDCWEAPEKKDDQYLIKSWTDDEGRPPKVYYTTLDILFEAVRIQRQKFAKNTDHLMKQDVGKTTDSE